MSFTASVSTKDIELCKVAEDGMLRLAVAFFLSFPHLHCLLVLGIWRVQNALDTRPAFTKKLRSRV